METSTISSYLKTRQPRQLCQLEEDLLRCLESDLLKNNSVPVADATILDGAAVVQMLNPGTSRTFQEYGESVFAPYISAQLEKSSRINLVWDVYVPASLKPQPERRGEWVPGKGWLLLLPKNWKDFLWCDENKTKLFAFLSHNLFIFL